MLKYLIQFGFLLLMILPLEARHIIGGEANYVITKTDGIEGGFANIDVSFIIYRDKYGLGADFDKPAKFGVYQQIGPSNWMVIDSIFIQPTNITDINLTYDPCVVPPTNIGADKGEYHFSTRLKILKSASYMIAYQRCCRNNTINNIVDPFRTGAAYMVEITPEAQLQGNSNPMFNDLPPLVICSGIEFSYDHSAVDQDGDSLVYYYYNPFHAGGLRGSDPQFPGSLFACDGVIPAAHCLPPYPLVEFQSPYTYTVPLGGAPLVRIHRFTGMINGVPNVLGQFVVGVRVDEYRNGKLIGYTQRDFQFNVTPCEPKVYAEIEHDALLGTKKYVINSCGDYTVQFKNISEDRAFIFENTWIFDINGKKETVDSWDAAVEFPGLGSYTGKLILNQGTTCADSANIIVNIFPEVHADFEYTYDTCVAGPVNFTDRSYTSSGELKKWFWDLEPDHKSFIKNPSYFYGTPGEKPVQLIVEDKNKCLDTIMRDIPYYPAPAIVVVEPSQFIGCSPAELSFVNLSKPIDDSYITNWSFGDGGTSDELHPSYVFDQPGVYDVEIEIISPIGCSVSRKYPNWITIKEGPEAEFSYLPEKPSINNSTIEFIDESIDAAQWQWLFGDGNISFDQSPVHSYRDTGVYQVQLIVTHTNNCTDTLTKLLDVEPIINYFMPNAFTPNGDGTNELFHGLGTFTEGMKSFHMSIWSRWGAMLFETNDPFEGWNGRQNNVGELLPQGVYIYKVEYIDARGMPVKMEGFATLVR